jgi:hypothetical protein
MRMNLRTKSITQTADKTTAVMSFVEVAADGSPINPTPAGPGATMGIGSLTIFAEGEEIAAYQVGNDYMMQLTLITEPKV